jgi:hypothetical protein
MIKDYLYAVGKYLSPSQREEILKDIEVNLYDYLEQNYGSREYSDDEVENAILYLGNPKKVAEGYFDKPRCLIGPPYLDTYLLVVKLAVAGVSIGMAVSLLISFSSLDQLPVFMLKLLGSIWHAGVSVIGTVTIIFAALYHYSPENKEFDEENWDVKKLEKAPVKDEKVKLSDVLFESIFTIFILILLNQNLFQNFGTEGNIPGLNDEVIAPYLIWFNLIMAATLLMNLYLLIKRRWQNVTRVLTILLDFAGIWLFGILAFTPNMWDFSNIQGVTPESLEGINTGLQLGLKIGFGAIAIVIAFETFNHIKIMVKK